ncbi:MAG: hypothetical protein NUV86_09200 [Candidatus Scalindua sp.]|nr:hypothetical protein [Candidatus Scalindua sp.]
MTTSDQSTLIGAGGCIGVVTKMPAGAALGKVIAKYIDTQEKDRSESISETDYKSTQGEMVKINYTETKPTNAKPGEDIGLRVSYHVIIDVRK